MTDKELRKLSRLELLEVLLEESKENEKLRKALNNRKSEFAIAEGINKLSELTRQTSEIIEFANSLSINLKEAAKQSSARSVGGVQTKFIGSVPQNSLARSAGESDRELYWRIMAFYSKNEEALKGLPFDIQTDIRKRLTEILNNLKNKRDVLSQENPIDGNK